MNESRTISILAAARLLGISRNSAYAAAKRGEIPVVVIGRRLLVPRQALNRLIGGAVEERMPEQD